jgi:transposase
MTYEHRDGPDDPPYASTYRTIEEAASAARRRANRKRHPIQVWRVDPDRGEYCEGEVG